MQIPIPPVNQWRNTQTARADQEKYCGKNARSAPRWSPPTQITGGQAMTCLRSGVIVVVVIRNLLSFWVSREI